MMSQVVQGYSLQDMSSCYGCRCHSDNRISLFHESAGCNSLSSIQRDNS